MNRRHLLTALLAATAAPATAAPERPAQGLVSILVDLSRTWHNQSSLARNRRLLQAVGLAIVGGQAGLPKPIQVSYRIIGENSLTREAYFTTRFAPSLLAADSTGSTGNANRFRDRLAGPANWAPGPVASPYDPVPLTMLRLPPEQRTEIMAAIIAARRADALAGADAKRLMILLSDFVEDSRGDWQLTDSLNGYRIWLIGRVLPDDARNAAALPARMRALEMNLERRGAVVQTLEESALLASPAAFAARIDEAGRK